MFPIVLLRILRMIYYGLLSSALLRFVIPWRSGASSTLIRHKCASFSRKETIDYCLLNCVRVKPVWSHFSSALSLLLGVFFIFFNGFGLIRRMLVLHVFWLRQFFLEFGNFETRLHSLIEPRILVRSCAIYPDWYPQTNFCWSLSSPTLGFCDCLGIPHPV